jgi:chromosome segregation ATPase
MDLIYKCINNHPQARAHASEIVGQVAEMMLQFPASFANRLEILRQIERERREKSALSEEGERKDGIILQKENQISSLRKEVQVEKEQKPIEMERLKFSHSTEVKQLQLQLGDMETRNQYTKAENEAEIVELKSKYSALEIQIENKTKILLKEREQSARQLREEREQYEIQLETSRKLISDVQDKLSRSKSEITTLQGTVSRLQSDITDKDTAIQMKDAIVRRLDTELEAKNRALGEKDATISAMSEQITKTRYYLATTKLQVSNYFQILQFWLKLHFISAKICIATWK